MRWEFLAPKKRLVMFFVLRRALIAASSSPTGLSIVNYSKSTLL